MIVNLDLCSTCGRPWHPPALCWAYDWLDVETIERIAANVFRASFEEWDNATQDVIYSLSRWESEGGR